MAPSPTALSVALLGCGTVGQEVARILMEDAEELAARTGARLDLVGVGVRDTSADRGPHVSRDIVTADLEGLVDRADIVVELMGGLEPAGSLILRALRAGKTVVSANKALIAARLEELSTAATESGVQFSYEAAVAGAIPILRPIRDSLAGDRITSIMGIVNGTTNYILDMMTTHGSGFDDALARAQELGYAEADPTADVGGGDAAAKAAILASLGLHTVFPLEAVHTEGITEVTSRDIEAARASGHVIRFLAIAERVAREGGADAASVRVHPTLVPADHPLAAVRGAFNAVYVTADNAGELMFMGQGAGGAPTASAVMGDLVSAARRVVAGGPGRTEAAARSIEALPFAESRTRYAVAVVVEDRPGVLEQIARVFSAHGQSIESMSQGRAPEGADAAAELRIITHEGAEGDLHATVQDLASLPSVIRKPTFMRVGAK
ncbi:homoserine dehydrogenase [Falsarthrobacter nasiphocae]|uniref:Homoserine dehydrogenase n=1 Tax=Falsarthrobacter nasiphocae TaxID=189863 RepID=A0AAE3YID7_9MICC|nr:homoserine dehydrogenase [Falsarthrobacter nasiphocae]MDR6892760.1 homoserine dehydrogenase [Falsarthrobacter nasiphocae]